MELFLGSLNSVPLIFTTCRVVGLCMKLSLDVERLEYFKWTYFDFTQCQAMWWCTYRYRSSLERDRRSMCHVDRSMMASHLHNMNTVSWPINPAICEMNEIQSLNVWSLPTKQLTCGFKRKHDYVTTTVPLRYYSITYWYLQSYCDDMRFHHI